VIDNTHIHLYNNLVIYDIIFFFLKKKIILITAVPVNLICIVTRITITIWSYFNKMFLYWFSEDRRNY